MLAELLKNGIECDLRKLQVGDFLWVAREKTQAQPGKSIVYYSTCIFLVLHWNGHFWYVWNRWYWLMDELFSVLQHWMVKFKCPLEKMCLQKLLFFRYYTTINKSYDSWLCGWDSYPLATYAASVLESTRFQSENWPSTFLHLKTLHILIHNFFGQGAHVYQIDKHVIYCTFWLIGMLNKPQGRELVLDYIIERKRMDDLVSSMIDGRFREQKVHFEIWSNCNNLIVLF